MYRQTALGVPECRPPIQPAPHPGRYHLAGDPWPMYGSLDESTVWAEWSQATGGAVAPEDDPRWLCVFDADLIVLDLRRPEVLDALDVDVDALNAPWAPGSPNRDCLRVSVAAKVAGAEAIVVPSAAAPSAWNLDVLSSGLHGLRRLSRTRTTPEPPTA